MRMESIWRRNERENVTEGQRLAQAMQEQIARGGQTLTVTTPPPFGGSATTRQIAFVPQPISASTLTRLQYEGVINIANGMTMDFVCAGDAVPAGGDEIGPFQGAMWQVFGVQSETYAGVVLARHAIAARQ